LSRPAVRTLDMLIVVKTTMKATRMACAGASGSGTKNAS